MRIVTRRNRFLKYRLGDILHGLEPDQRPAADPGPGDRPGETFTLKQLDENYFGDLLGSCEGTSSLLLPSKGR
jgi:hypothetical protein